MTKKILFISLILLSFTQFLVAQKPVSPTKKKLVSELVAKTSAIFPSDEFVELYRKILEEKSAKTETEITAMIVSNVDATPTMTEQEKVAAKAKIPELSKKISEVSKAIISKDFLIKEWVNESFQKHYPAKFTVAELRQLNQYFQTENGKSMVENFKFFIIGGLKDKNVEPDEKTLAKMGNFLKTRIGNKFFNILLENIFSDINSKTDAWGDNIIKELEKSMNKGEMKRLFEEFVSKNIKV